MTYFVYHKIKTNNLVSNFWAYVYDCVTINFNEIFYGPGYLSLCPYVWKSPVHRKIEKKRSFDVDKCIYNLAITLIRPADKNA